MVSSPYDTPSIVDFLEPYLAGSANLVVHSPFLEPLASLQQHLKRSGQWTASNITEGTLRRYQVHPGRTHPEMNGIGPAGFLLHAFHILTSDTLGELLPKRAKKAKVESTIKVDKVEAKVEAKEESASMPDSKGMQGIAVEAAEGT